jgi:hypothetical protein
MYEAHTCALDTVEHIFGTLPKSTEIVQVKQSRYRHAGAKGGEV